MYQQQVGGQATTNGTRIRTGCRCAVRHKMSV